MNIGDCVTRGQFLRFLGQPPEVLTGVPFKEIVQKALDLGIKEVELADACQVSEGIIGRWQSGHVVPHDLICRTCIDQTKKLLARVPA